MENNIEQHRAKMSVHGDQNMVEWTQKKVSDNTCLDKGAIKASKRLTVSLTALVLVLMTKADIEHPNSAGDRVACLLACLLAEGSDQISRHSKSFLELSLGCPRPPNLLSRSQKRYILALKLGSSQKNGNCCPLSACWCGFSGFQCSSLCITFASKTIDCLNNSQLR